MAPEGVHLTIRQGYNSLQPVGEPTERKCDKNKWFFKPLQLIVPHLTNITSHGGGSSKIKFSKKTKIKQ
jgi:hypothetical protein